MANGAKHALSAVETSSAITVYGLQTVGTQNMITVNGADVASLRRQYRGYRLIDTIGCVQGVENGSLTWRNS